jgi:predicted NAD-dependent protein-ADP-ribosyltransferase YbiA (DUF1768 family)
MEQTQTQTPGQKRRPENDGGRPAKRAKKAACTKDPRKKAPAAPKKKPPGPQAQEDRGIGLFYSKSKRATTTFARVAGDDWREYLSNFQRVPAAEGLNVRGARYATVEHFFQGQKYSAASACQFALGGGELGDGPALAAKLAGGRKGMAARGEALDVAAWGATRRAVMHEAVVARCAQDARFASILRAARAAGIRLVHFERGGIKSYWGGTVDWDSAEGRVRGENVLGEIMAVVAESL